MPMVSFQHSGSGNYIIIDGTVKGHISAGPECYVSVTVTDKSWTDCTWSEKVTIARFKYNRPVQNAKGWCKTVLSALDMVDVCERLRNTTPYNLQKHIEEGRIPA